LSPGEDEKFAYSINIYAMGLKVKFFLVKKVSIVTRGVRPVVALPIADLFIFAQAIGPVAPLLAARRHVGLAVLLIMLLYEGENLVSESLARLCESHDVGDV